MGYGRRERALKRAPNDVLLQGNASARHLPCAGTNLSSPWALPAYWPGEEEGRGAAAERAAAARRAAAAAHWSVGLESVHDAVLRDAALHAPNESLAGPPDHAYVAAVAPLILVSRPSFCRVPPGMRSTLSLSSLSLSLALSFFVSFRGGTRF